MATIFNEIAKICLRDRKPQIYWNIFKAAYIFETTLKMNIIAKLLLGFLTCKNPKIFRLRRDDSAYDNSLLMSDDLKAINYNYKAININFKKQIGNYIQWNSQNLSQETPNLLEHFQSCLHFQNCL